MRILFFAALILLIVWWMFSRRRSAPNGMGSQPTAAVYHQLRERALRESPGDVGLAPDVPTSGTWGVIMDTYMESPGAVVTVTSFIDGNASIYFSAGSGFIGGVTKPGIYAAALAFVQAAEQVERHMQDTRVFPLPKRGETIFYVRTGDRILMTSAPTADLQRHYHGLSPLYMAGQKVIEQYRLDREKR